MGDLRLIVEVVDSKGQPVEGAFVTVLEATRPIPEVALLTGSHGRLSLPLSSGRVRVSAVAEGQKAEGSAVLETDDTILRLVLPTD